MIKENPEITKPKLYRFAIYLSDTSEDNVLSVLELFRSTSFEGARIGLKLDSSTQKGQFVSTGSKNVARATYRICKYAIQQEYVSSDNKKYFVDIQGTVYVIIYYTFCVELTRFILYILCIA